jgi:hypothetical protein
MLHPSTDFRSTRPQDFSKLNVMKPKYLLSAMIIVLACFDLLSETQAVVPPPDGGYPGENTAEGQSALLNLTTGGFNTALGWSSLRALTTGSFNTGVGAGTLALNNGEQNTAIGAGALLLNATGLNNTATGALALLHNTMGLSNTATGAGALLSNVDGSQNTANGSEALSSNTTGFENTADGYQALFATTTGANNTGVGRQALADNTTGGDNTAVGRDALANNTTGSNNIALGVGAGVSLVAGDNNIYIGNPGGGESDTIRIGNSQTGTFIAGITGVPVTGTAVVVNIFGQLGVAPSSERYKDNIKPMGKVSDTLLALEPVAFRYKKEIDPAGTPQFGLIAEDVEKVNPDLVVHDKQGRAYSVRYDQVNAMLLNEFLKEHRAFVEERRQVANQQDEIDALKAELKDQRALISKISDRMEMKNAMLQGTGLGDTHRTVSTLRTTP